MMMKHLYIKGLRESVKLGVVSTFILLHTEGERCTTDRLQSGKPTGAGLSDKTVGSIIRYCLFLYLTIKRCIEQAIMLQEQTRSNDILL